MNMIDRNKYDNLSLRITLESHNLARFRGVKFNVEAIKARRHTRWCYLRLLYRIIKLVDNAVCLFCVLLFCFGK